MVELTWVAIFDLNRCEMWAFWSLVGLYPKYVPDLSSVCLFFPRRTAFRAIPQMIAIPHINVQTDRGN